MLWYYSLEAPRQGASDKCPQHMFSWRNKKNFLSDTDSYLDLCICFQGEIKENPFFSVEKKKVPYSGALCTVVLILICGQGAMFA